MKSINELIKEINELKSELHNKDFLLTWEQSPEELKEWTDAISSVIAFDGPERADALLAAAVEKARRHGAHVPFARNTAYINTIGPDEQPDHPGERDLEHRIPGNLNISFNFVEGESLIMALKDVAVSSGSACTSASLEPSYVLRALGRSDELAHSSIRFTLGRFTTEEEVDYTIGLVKAKIDKLRELSPLWEMYKEGIDLDTVQWAAH